MNITRRNLVKLAGAAGIASFLAACDNGGGSGDPAETPMVVGYSNFSSKFSPFFAESAYDQDAQVVTQLPLIPTGRLGEVIYKGIEGETYPYNGTDYTYTGPADIEVTENGDGTVTYDITLREDLVFSDGEPVTIDDYIFSAYVRCDPTYDGSASLYAMPVRGMAEYRSGMVTRLDAILAAGEDNTDFTNWTQEQQEAVFALKETAPAILAQEIVDYCVAAGYNEEGDIAGAAGNWGFSIPEDGTIEDFAQALIDGYTDEEGNFDFMTMINVENAGSSADVLLADYWDDFQIGVEVGESAKSVSGIEKTGDYSCRITADKVDALLIYQLGFEISPLHYYGDPELFNGEDSFGFPKGDLSLIRAKTTEPMGAGPYKFIKYENGVINYEANENYFKGAPLTKYMQFREMTDNDKLNGLLTGTIDVTDPSWSKETAAAVAEENGGELTGEVLTTSLVDNLGYGYLGMNSHNMSVGGQPGSDASKALRKAFGTILSVYREVSVDSYYGDAAEVINYPISNTSWAAPRPTDDGYRVAFSVDAQGNDIYTSEMTPDEKYAAAAAAALTFFEAAGYTVEDGKVTAAPQGAKLEYEVMVPADGVGNHPAFMMLTEGKNALAELGINLIINDLSNSSDLWSALSAGQAEMWTAAWGATIDPDMTQIYFADVANGGANAGGNNYMYQIEDPELDRLILEGRASTDPEYRKQIYKAALDIVIDWACEVPTYQRKNAIVFSTKRVDIDTVTPDISTFYGWMGDLEGIQMR